MRLGRRVGRALAVAGLLGCAAGGELGCAHRPLERANARGDYAAAVARVQAKKRPPQGRAARAYATALVGLDRIEEARAVLLRDFRTSGEVTSMIALADLEASQGLLGIAASHYSRAATLAPDHLAGRGDVCELLRQRARVFLSQGEALAADQDLRRVRLLCPVPPGSIEGLADAELEAAIRPAAEAAARALRTLQGCGDGGCAAGRSERAGVLALALGEARTRGPRALRRVAQELEVSLAPEDVVTLLGAELRGELGVALITNDELRGWIGEGSMEGLARATEALPRGAERAYVHLRLGRLGPGYTLPVAEEEPASEAAMVTLTLEALDERGPASAALGWRVLALIGDLPGAEMTLVAGLRGAGAAAGGTGEPAASEGVEAAEGAERSEGGHARSAPWQKEVPAPSYAAGRIPVGPGTWRLMLVLARMRAVAGSPDQSLEILRYALAEARALGFDDARERAHEAAHDLLARGQPWQAMAVSAAVGGSEAVDGAAAAAILLQRAACTAACGEAEDRGVAARVVGEAWIAEREAALLGLVRRRAFATTASPFPGCPSLAELLAGDAVGPIAEGLAAARSGADGAERGLRRAIEADLGIACAGRWAAPLMIGRGDRVGAGILFDHLSQAPQMISAGGLATHAELALAAGQEESARALIDAAAGQSPDPIAVWSRAAWIGRLADAREFELGALRQVLLHGASPAEARWAHLALVRRALSDANHAWAIRESPVGGEVLAEVVSDYLGRYAADERWWAREALARELAELPWVDETAAAPVRRALWGGMEFTAVHPAAYLRLERAFGATLPGPADPLSPQEAAALVDGTDRTEGAGSLEVLFAAGDLSDLYLRRATLARGEGSREEEALGLAIAVATSGGPRERERALQLLLHRLRAVQGDGQGEVGRRRAVEALLLGDLPALAPGSSASEPLLRDPTVWLEILFGIGEAGHVWGIPR